MKSLLLVFFSMFALVQPLAAEDDYVLAEHMEAGVGKFYSILRKVSKRKPQDPIDGLPTEKVFAEKTLEVWKKKLLFPKEKESKLRQNKPVRTAADFRAKVFRTPFGENQDELRKDLIGYFLDKKIHEAEKEVVYTLLIYVVEERK